MSQRSAVIISMTRDEVVKLVGGDSDMTLWTAQHNLERDRFEVLVIDNMYRLPKVNEGEACLRVSLKEFEAILWGDE